MSKICFITAIYGNYEVCCKKYVKQTIETDFICFTDNINIISNGWVIDTHPYHLTNKNEQDNNEFVNSLCNNNHTFNIAKYYKQSFHCIPILKKYDVIVWVDGTIEIVYKKTSEYIINNIYEKKIIGWHHEFRNGILKNEVDASLTDNRYISTYWNNQRQPYQDLNKQYNDYIKDGYNETFFKNINLTPNYGVWITCFIAFLNNNQEVKSFLELWYLQTLKYTTQDQVGFPYVCQKTNLLPYTLPDNLIYGDCPHSNTMFYIKHLHKYNYINNNINFPLEYEEHIYKNKNSHLKKFSSQQLLQHYNFYGKHEGLICSKIQNRIDFFNLINKDSYILEIGPLCNPLMDINNPKVKTLDYFTQEELKNNYKYDVNVNINNIVKVDYCVRDIKNYTDIIYLKFDYCVSSHNIEHAPCFITFLQNISSILKNGGYFFLAIPDYRFCFDRFKKPSDIFSVLNKYYSKIDKPQAEQILEDRYFITHNNSLDHWNNFSKMYSNIFVNINEYERFIYSKKNDIIENINNIKNIIETDSKNYIDAHCWKLTPFTFSYIVDILIKTKLIDLSIERVYKTIKGSNEFYAILKK